ncbi:polyketide cyclase [Rhizobium sp. Leaf384]|uniref:hypothetical protein n=1 Tax=unclassified Rhizobium TaxID=2613769 RepID=UPI00071628FB|nr:MULTISPECIES: hypothetical protein [unclassified Rhizobium]KQR68878.1 polyketide cyclase [Rhizobium sp. Leaf341]KQS79292.1 polyketide cyclase [Rhizobium sp. Leaf384]KQS82860.1 polyketide cyclase [Rhizobium sp. Leaf383]
MIRNVRIVDVTIERDAAAVYAFASRPETMPLWASGLASGLVPAGDHWIATGPLGIARIVFTPENSLGVLDHTVILETGETTYNAFRVTPNGDNGAVVVFTVLQQPGADEESFRRDADWVRKDLMQLKSILEAMPPEA